MAKCHGIHVDILINDQPQRIYDDPDAEESTNLTEKLFYVEAVSDAQFAVNVTLEPGFDILGADGCRIILRLDGNRWARYVSKDLIRHAHRVQRRGFTEIFSTRRFYDSETHQEMEGKLSFGSLSILESTNILENPATFQGLGKIQVRVERVNATPKAKPKTHSSNIYKAVTQVSEKVLKGQAIENSIRVTNVVPAEPRTPSTHKAVPLRGPAGQQFGFDILYRSKRSLQSLGCISRTPSPVPEPPSVKEFEALKARLAILERGLSIKAESSESKLDLTATGSRSAARIKREQGGEVENSSRKRLRKSKIEVVDLTGD